MYQKGDYIVYGMNGPCLVEDITRLSIPGSDSRRKYYVLRPVNSGKSTIYSPVDNDKVTIRDIVSKKEAQSLLYDIPDIPEVPVENEKLREEQYKEIIKQSDPRLCVGLLKTLCHKRQSRIREGRKFTTVDERYLREIAAILSSELAIALEEEKESAAKQIWNKIETA